MEVVLGGFLPVHIYHHAHMKQMKKTSLSHLCQINFHEERCCPSPLVLCCRSGRADTLSRRVAGECSLEYLLYLQRAFFSFLVLNFPCHVEYFGQVLHLTVLRCGPCLLTELLTTDMVMHREQVVNFFFAAVVSAWKSDQRV